MATVYSWAPGTQVTIPAEVAGEALNTLVKEHGVLSPALVVDAARPANAPLHPAFEWDDHVAAESYRREQARHIIHHLRVEVSSENPRPQFVNVVLKEPKEVQPSPYVKQLEQKIAVPSRGYMPLESVLADPVLRARVLQDALNAFVSLRRKYAALKELAGIFDAIDSGQQLLLPVQEVPVQEMATIIE
jgi:hypothetical protein